MSRLSAHLVTWNGSKYIPYLFDSLRKQTFTEWELLVIDNNSTDDTVTLIQKELLNFPVPSRLIVNKDNKGFAGGHNQAFHLTSSPYFLLLNQDIYVTPDCLGKLVAFLDKEHSAATAAPRLMRWAFDTIPSPIPPEAGPRLAAVVRGGAGGGVGGGSFTNEIDSLGLKVFRNRRVIEQGTGQGWGDFARDLPSIPSFAPPPAMRGPAVAGKEGRSQTPSATAEGAGGGLAPFKVFGVSGAFPMYRRSAIEKVLYADGSMLDEAHFMYKEDVDLAYRLVQAGLSSYVVPGSVAYHDRTGAGPTELTDLAAAKNKQAHNQTVRYHSYKNHLMVLYKNEYWQNLLLDFPWIFWYELKKFVYFLLFDRQVLRGLKELWQGRARLKDKRIKIKEIRKIGWREMREWWKK